MRKLCDANDVLLILDEVQSGLGRAGDWFAFHHEKVVPDGVILGKALGGGVLPVSAFVGKAELMDVFTPGSHGSTFGGNPLAAAVGLEALKVHRGREGLSSAAAILGAHMLERLRAIKNPVLKDVRGRGLWAGAEIDPSYAQRARCLLSPAGERRALEGYPWHRRALRAAACDLARRSRYRARCRSRKRSTKSEKKSSKNPSRTPPSRDSRRWHNHSK